MAQWGNSDDAANSVLWAVGQLKKDVTAANRNDLFGNTTADSYFSGATHGTFGVSESEVRAARAGGGVKAAHNGLVLRTTGSGGRAGRVTNEVLVAFGGDITGDAEDTAFADFYLNITTQPQDATSNTSSSATFTIGVTSTPTGALTYQWEYTVDPGNTASYSNADIAQFSNDSASSITFTSEGNTYFDGTLIRVVLSNGDETVTSDAATLTVTV